MFRSSLFLVCALAAVTVRAAPLVGRMEGDTYVSPTGEFRIRAPVLPELGGTIEDNSSVVTFHDDFGTHLSIACFDLDATQRWEFETRGLRDYLLYFFTDIVLANFKSRFPGSSIESARFLPDLAGGALIAYALLPGGSNFEEASRVAGGPPPAPVIAKRGSLLFVHHRHVYVLSLELAERATQRNSYHLTTQQEDDQLSTRLTAAAGRMTFTDDKPRSP
ncbi:MAG: hypothetical protein WDM96_05830 [Lacunisphaera sp.]